MAIIFRTNDNTKWGTGQGSDLSASQIDDNIWELFSAITALQDHATSNGAGISFFQTVGDQFYVHLTDHTVLGPYQLPTSQWNFRGEWLPATAYSVMDVVTSAGSVYLVIFAHESVSHFDAGENDGLGHDFYAVLLGPAASLMPAGGTIAQRLIKNSSTDYDASWANEPRNVSIYIEGQPTSGEALMRYTCTDILTFPAGLSSSRASSGIASTGASSFNLFKNGAAIGTVNFAAAATTATFSFSADVTFAVGDVLTITGPASPDATLANIGITLVGLITG